MKETIQLINYFNKMSERGKIDKCFEESNKAEFLKHCKILSKANISLGEFLDRYTGLTYSKCYEIQVVPAIRQMIKSHKARTGTTRNITNTDPYLRHKIEVAEKVTGKYSMVELIDELDIDGDNAGDGRARLTDNEIELRKNILVRKLKSLYPTGKIDKDFIKQHPDLYEELKLVSNRKGYESMDDFLKAEGFFRERFHERVIDSVFYLSEGDLRFYNFNGVSPECLTEWGLKELEPSEYIGVYNKLIALGNDHMQFRNENPYYLGE